MTTAKHHKDEQHLFDPATVPDRERIDGEDEDPTILWIPPRVVHECAHDVIDRFIAGTRIDSDDHSKRTVLRFTGRRRGFVRVRDSQRLAKHPDHIYQATIRRTTPKQKSVAQEWAMMEAGEFDLFATVWVDIIDITAPTDGKRSQVSKLDVRSCVVLDVPNLMRDIRERPSCLVPHPQTKSLLFRAPGGAMFHAVDIRRVAPDTRVLVHGIDGERSWTPAPVNEHVRMFT